MKIISEVTGKTYKTVEECLAAEKAFERAQQEENERKKALQEEKEKRLEEIKKAKSVIEEAKKKYFELQDAYAKDYNTVVIEIDDKDKALTKAFEDIMKFWFK